MTGRKRRGEPGYEWVEQLNKDQLEELANKLIKGKGEYTEEITQSSDSDSLGSLDGEETLEREDVEQATVTDQRSKVPTQSESAARADPRAGRSGSTEPDFPGFGEYFDSVQSPTELVALGTPDIPKLLSS